MELHWDDLKKPQKERFRKFVHAMLREHRTSCFGYGSYDRKDYLGCPKRYWYGIRRRPGTSVFTLKGMSCENLCCTLFSYSNSNSRSFGCPCSTFGYEAFEELTKIVLNEERKKE